MDKRTILPLALVAAAATGCLDAREACAPAGPVPVEVTLLEDGDGCWDAPGPEVAWDWRTEWLPLGDRPRVLEDEVDGCSQHYEVTSDGIGHAVWLEWTPDGPVGEVITLGDCHAHWRIEPAERSDVERPGLAN